MIGCWYGCSKVRPLGTGPIAEEDVQRHEREGGKVMLLSLGVKWPEVVQFSTDKIEDFGSNQVLIVMPIFVTI